MQLVARTPDEVIADIAAKLEEKPRQPGAAYALIVGAGFSHPVVPLTRELLHERIGDFYYPPDGTSEGSERSRRQRLKLSQRYWKDFNEAGALVNEPFIPLDRNGLPDNPSAAYQTLFNYRTANALFSPLAGEKFVRDFLQDTLDPGGYESRGEGWGARPDYCTTGRNCLNGAHFFLASLIELQQTGVLWKLRPFCRTIFTTNFDTLLQESLQLVNVLYSITDRPERGMDPADFPQDERTVHLVYTHGTILRHNAASTTGELGSLGRKNTEVLKGFLESRDVLVFGYGGWDDSLMSALLACGAGKHRVYWCNVFPPEKAMKALPPLVLELLTRAPGKGFYVPLGEEGAGGFMSRLYRTLAPDHSLPPLLRDPLTSLVHRLRRVTIEPMTWAVAHPHQVSDGELPPPQLNASIARIHGTACRVVDAARRFFITGGACEWTGIQEGAQALVEEGFALVLAGMTDKALSVWARVVALPEVPYESAQAANYIGIVQHRTGNLDIAIPAYALALERGRVSPSLQVEAATNRGTAHHQKNQLDLASDDFSRAIGIWENHPPAVSKPLAARALIYRGLTRERIGDTAGASEDYRRAAELKETPPECSMLLARSAVWLNASTNTQSG